MARPFIDQHGKFLSGAPNGSGTAGQRTLATNGNGCKSPVIRPMPRGAAIGQCAGTEPEYGAMHDRSTRTVLRRAGGPCRRGAPCVVAIGTGRRHVSGILWRPDVVVTSAQMLPERDRLHAPSAAVRKRRAQLAGRDPGTNVAVLRLAQPLDTTLPTAAPSLAPVARPGAAGRRGRHRCATGSARHGARHRTGMAQPGRRSDRRAAAAGRAARRRRGRCRC